MAPYVRADVRRAQLLSAARQVLARDGLDRLTLRAVAEQADVRLSTLQYIFSSRAELVTALAEWVLEESRGARPPVGSRGLDVELKAVIDFYAVPVLADRPIVELIRSEFVADANAGLTSEPTVYPTGRSVLLQLVAEHVSEACARSNEAYDVPEEVLVRLWGLGLIGVLWGFLRDGDAEVFRSDGHLVVDALTALANPHPRQ